MTSSDVRLEHLIEPASTERAGDGTFPILSMTMHDGLVDQSTKFKKRVASSDTSDYKVVSRNQLVVGFPIDEGVLSIQDLYHKAIVSPAYDVWNLRPDYELEPAYLERYLRSPRALAFYRAKLRGTTARRRTIPDDVFLTLMVSLPPLPQQRRIVEVLDRAETLRVNRRTGLAQLEALTQSIFLDMFGDPILNPKGWPNPTLGGVLTFQQYGPRFFNESYSRDGTRIVRITDLNEAGGLDFIGMPRLAVSDEDREKYLLRPGDLIFARSGATVGKVALIQPDDPPCIAGAYFITMRFDQAIDSVYARAVLSAPSVRAIVAKRSRQAAQQNFSGPGLRQLPMPCPPIRLQREFVHKVKAVEKLKESHNASFAQLDALLASLQDRAFRGEL